MPNNIKLSTTEKILSCLAFIVVAASIGLALCIGLILPRDWTTKGYVNNKTGRSAEELSVMCGCERKKVTTNFINCIPRTISDRILTQEETVKSPEVCELVQDYPYLVSLNVAAYNDDSNERRFACSGTILSKFWILIGEDCVQNEDEFKALRVRAGSTYWSKGGKEYTLTSLSKFSDKGPTAVKLHVPLKFDKYVSAVRVPRNNMYTRWISAVSVGWRKGNDKKYDKFIVQKWTTTPCADHCHVGKVMGEPDCERKIFGRSLVAENRLLVGLKTGMCNAANRSEFMYVNLQTSIYQSWFEFLLGKEVEPEEKNNTGFQWLQRALKGTTAGPISIYEVRECVVLNPSRLPEQRTDSPITEDEIKSSSKIKKEKPEGKNTEMTEEVKEQKNTKYSEKTDETKETSDISTANFEGTTFKTSTETSSSEELRTEKLPFVTSRISMASEKSTIDTTVSFYFFPLFPDTTIAISTVTKKQRSIPVVNTETYAPLFPDRRKSVRRLPADDDDEYEDEDDDDNDNDEKEKESDEEVFKTKLVIPLTTAFPNDISNTRNKN